MFTISIAEFQSHGSSYLRAFIVDSADIAECAVVLASVITNILLAAARPPEIVKRIE